MNILLAVDGSPHTKKMLAYLTTHLEALGANNTFTVLTVEPPLPPRALAIVGAEVAENFHSESAAKVLEPVATFLQRHSFSLQTAFRVGPAGETIAEFAEAGKFDLLIMGSHGHGALGNLIMGSVATKVLANCKVPVLLVR